MIMECMRVRLGERVSRYARLQTFPQPSHAACVYRCADQKTHAACEYSSSSSSSIVVVAAVV